LWQIFAIFTTKQYPYTQFVIHEMSHKNFQANSYQPMKIFYGEFYAANRKTKTYA